MATLTSKYSLAEQAKRLDPDGGQATIVEVLDREMGGLVEDAPWLPSNDIWVNKTVRRGSLPSSTRRKINTGVATGVSRATEVLDVIQMREIYAEYDIEYIDNMPSPAVARRIEAMAFLEGIGQDIVSDILYADANADPDAMHGLAARLGTTDGAFVIDGGGTGSDVTSIYVVSWGELLAHLIYPKNSPSYGLKHKDLGEVTISTATTAAASTAQYQGYRDWFQVKSGLAIRHPKAIGRYANIESSGSSNIYDEDNLITMMNKMKTGPGTRLYMNEDIMTQAEIRLKDKSNVVWTTEDGAGLGGAPLLKFRGFPVRKIDSSILLNTESAI